MRTLHVVVPDGIDDPTRPSGGNIYDRRVCQQLRSAGWQVHEYPVGGSWPGPSKRNECALARSLAPIPDDAVVLVDGLIASAAPSVLVPVAQRVRLVVLVHLPFGDSPPGHRIPGARSREQAVFTAARGIVVTSAWSRDLLLRTYPLDPRRICVAEPGVDPAPVAPGTPDGGQLLCVAAVSWHKGHDLLVAALARVTELRWQCRCVGPLDRDPAFTERLRRAVDVAGLGDRVEFTGSLAGADLDGVYAGADVLVLPSRGETHGMVVTEALARGLPAIAAAVGGVPDALGRTSDGRRPGLLVPPEDPEALAGAFRRWLCEPPLRARARRAAAARRTGLPGWAVTASRIAEAVRVAAR